jgi:hypothetical protein
LPATDRTPTVTYYTVSDHRFFLGTVALLNSLHVTGNSGAFVVIDTGLTPRERALLSERATVVSPPNEIAGHPVLMKPYPYRLSPSGTVVVIDSDIVVTGSLDPIVKLARDGKICAFPAWLPYARMRWFPEWETTLQLRSPLRREAWVHNGFVAFSTERWPHLLERWWEVCELVPTDQMWGSQSPFNAPDADALNALLMSEIPREAVAVLPQGDEVFGGDARIEDIQALRSTVDGRPARVLHLVDYPKPWDRSGWVRLAGADYLRLMRRLLFAADVPLRVDPRQAPLWLRPGAAGETALRALSAANRAVIWSSLKVPDSLQHRLRHLRRQLA